MIEEMDNFLMNELSSFSFSEECPKYPRLYEYQIRA